MLVVGVEASHRPLLLHEWELLFAVFVKQLSGLGGWGPQLQLLLPRGPEEKRLAGAAKLKG